VKHKFAADQLRQILQSLENTDQIDVTRRRGEARRADRLHPVHRRIKCPKNFPARVHFHHFMGGFSASKR
jgi:hypothetical protein